MWNGKIMRAFPSHNVQAGKPNTMPKINGNNPFFSAQAKLSVGKADDAYEREADAVADKIVQKSESHTSESTFFPPAAIQKKNNS